MCAACAQYIFIRMENVIIFRHEYGTHARQTCVRVWSTNFWMETFRKKIHNVRADAWYFLFTKLCSVIKGDEYHIMACLISYRVCCAVCALVRLENRLC